jgi:hypothetical protein
MKKYWPAVRYYLFLAFLIMSFMFVINSLYGQTTTATSSGNWDNNNTWNNNQPSCSTDTIIIPIGVTVLIKNETIDLSTCEVHIIINGTLELERTGNGGNISFLDLGVRSTITIDGGEIDAITNKSNKLNTISIDIAGNQVWDGTDGDILTDGIIDGSSVDGSQTGLPIELAYFNILPLEDFMLFKWKTYSEINNDYFSIMCDDEEIYRISGNGTTNVENIYEVRTKLYYGLFRLKQVDYNGNYSFSEYILIESPKDVSELEIYDIYGRKQNELKKGNINIIIDGNAIYKVFY